jgi:hypothetical protein
VFLSVLLGTGAAYAMGSDAYTFLLGSPRTGIGQVQGSKDVFLHSDGDLNIFADHVRHQSRDGNYEFEAKNPARTHFSAYKSGSGTRIPIWFGAGPEDDQNVVALQVAGATRQTADLQQWYVGERKAVAIDAKGRLVLGDITLILALSKGRVRLYAVLPDGTRQALTR